MSQTRNRRVEDIKIIKRAISLLLFISCFIEILVYPKITNVVLSFTSILSLIIFNKYIFRYDIIVKSPIAFLMFLNIQFFMYLPIPVTLLDGISADHDLLNPLTTFICQFLYYLISAVSFILAIRKVTNRNNRFTKQLKRIGFFSAPSVKFLWVLGAGGMVPRLILMVTPIEIGAGMLAILSFFMYSPILILFRPLLGCPKASPFHRKLVYFYIIGIVILLIGTNGRHYMITPILIFIAGSFTTYFLNQYKRSILTVKNIFIIITIFLIVSGPISNLATAMVIVRSLRSNISFEQLIQETWNTANNKEAIKQYMLLQENIGDNVLRTSWNENYVSNVFLERFCNYRVVDATIYHANKVGWCDEIMINKFVNALMILPPTPIPDILFGVSKTDTEGSQMDVLYARSTHQPIAAGLIVGGDVGLGLSVFGLCFFIIQFVVYYWFFRLINSLVFRLKDGRIVLSMFTLIQFMEYFNMFTVHSGIVRHIGFLFWNFWWITFIIVFIYKLLGYLLSNSSLKLANPKQFLW